MSTILSLLKSNGCEKYYSRLTAAGLTDLPTLSLKRQMLFALMPEDAANAIIERIEEISAADDIAHSHTHFDPGMVDEELNDWEETLRERLRSTASQCASGMLNADAPAKIGGVGNPMARRVNRQSIVQNSNKAEHARMLMAVVSSGKRSFRRFQEISKMLQAINNRGGDPVKRSDLMQERAHLQDYLEKTLVKLAQERKGLRRMDLMPDEDDSCIQTDEDPLLIAAQEKTKELRFEIDVLRGEFQRVAKERFEEEQRAKAEIQRQTEIVRRQERLIAEQRATIEELTESVTSIKNFTIPFFEVEYLPQQRQVIDDAARTELQSLYMDYQHDVAFTCMQSIRDLRLMHDSAVSASMEQKASLELRHKEELKSAGEVLRETEERSREELASLTARHAEEMAEAEREFQRQTSEMQEIQKKALEQLSDQVAEKHSAAVSLQKEKEASCLLIKELDSELRKTREVVESLSAIVYKEKREQESQTLTFREMKELAETELDTAASEAQQSFEERSQQRNRMDLPADFACELEIEGDIISASPLDLSNAIQAQGYDENVATWYAMLIFRHIFEQEQSHERQLVAAQQCENEGEDPTPHLERARYIESSLAALKQQLIFFLAYKKDLETGWSIDKLRERLRQLGIDLPDVVQSEDGETLDVPSGTELLETMLHSSWLVIEKLVGRRIPGRGKGKNKGGKEEGDDDDDTGPQVVTIEDEIMSNHLEMMRIVRALRAAFICFIERPQNLLQQKNAAEGKQRSPKREDDELVPRVYNLSPCDMDQVTGLPRGGQRTNPVAASAVTPKKGVEKYEDRLHFVPSPKRQDEER